MGMDVQGINPDAAVGQYFGRKIACWASLWDYCCSVSSLARQVKQPYTNDGDGLDAPRAGSLAKTLEDELENGRTSEYIAQQQKVLAEPAEAPRDEPCHVSERTGKVRASKPQYNLSERDVREFTDFLRRSGGFQIW